MTFLQYKAKVAYFHFLALKYFLLLYRIETLELTRFLCPYSESISEKYVIIRGRVEYRMYTLIQY